jgi:hypothetical protein
MKPKANVIARFLIPSLVLLVAVSACAQSAEAPTDRIEIPFTLVKNRITVKAKINNNGTFNLVFDTGAEGIVLNDSVAKALKLKGKGVTELGGPGNSMPVKAKNIDIPLLTLNDFSAKNLQGVAVDHKDAPPFNNDGVFGLSVFKGYLVTINYPESKLIISKGALKESDKDVIKIDLTRILESHVKLNGKEVLAHFDSGSPEYIALPMEWKTDLKLKSEPTFFAKARIGGGEAEVYKAQLSSKVEIGSLLINDPEITLITGGFPAVNLGFQFLKNYSLTIDMVNQLLRITPDKM